MSSSCSFPSFSVLHSQHALVHYYVLTAAEDITFEEPKKRNSVAMALHKDALRVEKEQHIRSKKKNRMTMAFLDRRKRKTVVPDQLQAAFDARIQNIVQHTKKKIAEYTAQSKRLPYLSGFTAAVETSVHQYKLEELDSEQLNKLSLTLVSFMDGIKLIKNVPEHEIFAINTSGFDELKKRVKQFIDHEQKVRFLATELSKQVNEIQSLFSNHEMQKLVDTLSFNEQVEEYTRILNSTFEVLEKVSLKQRFLFFRCEESMAQIYNDILAFWRITNMNKSHGDYAVTASGGSGNGDFSFEKSGPLPTEVWAYNFDSPIGSMELQGIVTRIIQVKSHLWVGFKDGKVNVMSKSCAVPSFKLLKSFQAHASTISDMLYLPTKSGLPGTVWTSSESGELSVWKPDTANKVHHLAIGDDEDPFQCLSLIPMTRGTFVWAVCANTRSIAIWDPKHVTIVNCIEYPYEENGLIKAVVVDPRGRGDCQKEGKISKGTNSAPGRVFGLAANFVFVFSLDGAYLFHWKAFPCYRGPLVMSHLLKQEDDKILVAYGNHFSTWLVDGEEASLIQDVAHLAEKDYITNVDESVTESGESILWLSFSSDQILLLDAATLAVIRTISTSNHQWGSVNGSIPVDTERLGIIASTHKKSTKDQNLLHLHSFLLWFQSCGPYVD